jgi:transposase
MRPLSSSKADDVKTLLRHGKSTRQVAMTLNVSHGFVTKIRLQDKENIPKPKMGRPIKVSKTTRQALKTKFLANDFNNENQKFEEAQEYICSVGEGPVHRQTIKRYLRAEGVVARVKPDSPFLTKKQMTARYEFAKDHIKWSMEDWKNVMFSDECSISRLGQSGRQWYYSNDEHRLRNQHQFKQKKQGGGGKIMIWGCVTYFGVGDMCWVEGYMNAEYYESVLRNYVIASREWYKMDPTTFVFQHDNASIHTTDNVNDYLSKAGINVMVWPPNSPDINPTERIWARIKQRLFLYPTPPANLQELFDRVENIWTSLSKFIQKLYEELPAKMEALVRTKGLHSKIDR